MEHYYLYTFESTHGAIAAQKLLKDRMQATIMPVLREINASCGISVRIPVEGYEESEEISALPSDIFAAGDDYYIRVAKPVWDEKAMIL